MIKKKTWNQKIENFSLLSRKLGQEEMVGFAVIIVIVSVIALILLGFLLKGTEKKAVENYEIESFIQSSLQYTSDCESYLGFLPVQELIISCEANNKCLDERDSCEVLKATMNNLITKSWDIGEKSAVKGYKWKIIVNEQEKSILQGGNETVNYIGGFQDFSRRSNNYEVFLNIYS
jgi:hypothetical protein